MLTDLIMTNYSVIILKKNLSICSSQNTSISVAHVSFEIVTIDFFFLVVITLFMREMLLTYYLLVFIQSVSPQNTHNN